MKKNTVAINRELRPILEVIAEQKGAPLWVELIPPAEIFQGRDGRSFTNPDPNQIIYAFELNGVDLLSVSITLDRDSWAWRLNAKLAQKSTLALVRPDGNCPKETDLNINGYTWSFLVDGYGRDRQFGTADITISGRSLSAYLGATYAPKRSAEITVNYTANQLADLELLNTGWAVSWQSPDWLVPAGAWSYQETDPITAIGKLAAAVGAKIRPQASAKVLEIIPRFPVSPHLWGSAQIDAILPEAMIQQEGGRLEAKSDL